MIPSSPVSGNQSPPGAGESATARRVLLVAQEHLAVSLAARIRKVAPDCTLDCVGGYLDALGKIATGGAADLVIGTLDGAAGVLEATAASLRRVAPRARLVLLVSPDQAGQHLHACAGGFDEQLTDNPTSEQLARLLGRPADAGPPAGGEPVMGPGALGDVDLVEQVLKRRSVVEVALRIMTEQSGIGQLGWVRRIEEVPARHANVPVASGTDACGLLHAAEPVTAEQLGPWGAWLERWLVLEQRVGQLWHMAMHDELTGVWNRRYFDRFLATILDRALRQRFCVTVMLFDIDDFKGYNDRFGHAAGDEILRQVARLMVSVVRDHDVVARIGGDEFGVVFWDAHGPRRPDSHHPDDVIQAAQRFQRAICDRRFRKLVEAPATLSVSGGLAGFPWDGRTSAQLLEFADRMAMQSKRQGKNAILLGPGARRQWASGALPNGQARQQQPGAGQDHSDRPG